MRHSDGIFGIVNGCPPDWAVMLELVMAIAWRKPIFLFTYGFRSCSDTSRYPRNLMQFTRLYRRGSEANGYTSVGELADPDKALSQ